MIIDLFQNFDLIYNSATIQSNDNITYGKLIYIFKILFHIYYKKNYKHVIQIAHKISSDMFFIDWMNQTSLEIDCQYRGLNEIVCLNFYINNLN
jgi:hypothetical protein